MYHLLIEAGGLRQISRIDVEACTRIIEDLNQIVGEAGFVPRLLDGDQMFYDAGDDSSIEPHLIASTVAKIERGLEARSDYILDYVVVLHMSDIGKPEHAFLEMQDLLRFARQFHCVYVTRPVRRALETVIETDNGEPLAIVRDFHQSHGLNGPSFGDTMLVPEVPDRLRDLIEADPSGRYLVTCPDIVKAERVVRAVVEGLQRDVLFIPIRCSQEMTAGVVSLHLLRAIPPDLAPIDSDTTTITNVLRSALHRRYCADAARNEEFPERLGELRWTAQATISAAAHRVSRVLVVHFDRDLCSEAIRAELETVFDELPPHVELTTIATAAAPIAGDWTRLNVPYKIDGPAEASRWHSAYAYWESLVNEYGGRDPILATRIDRRLRSVLGSLRRFLGENLRTALYLIDRTADVIAGDTITRFFPRLGIVPAERSRIITELSYYGLVSNDGVPVVHPAIAGSTAILLDAERRKTIERILVEILETLHQEGVLQITPHFWSLYQPLIDSDRRREIGHTYLHDTASRGAIQTFEAIAASAEIDRLPGELSVLSARVRLHLRDSLGPETCAGDAIRLAEILESESVVERERIDAMLSLGELALGERKYQQALGHAKRAIMIQQATGETVSQAESHLLIARIMLAERRVADAGHYLSFAREDAVDERGIYLVSEILDATRHFLHGNLAHADSAYDKLIEPLALYGHSDWMYLAWFGRVRVAFELGDYHAAAATAKEMEVTAERSGYPGPASVARRWRVRSALLGDGPVDELIGELGPEHTAESAFVEGESLVRRGDYETAAAVFDRGIAAEKNVDRWPRLGVCWDNGFAPLEDLLLADQPGSTELIRLLRALRAFAIAQTGKVDEAVEEFYRLTRTGSGMAEDPYTAFYTYLYASILPEERSREREDRTTVLGKSVKILQERTSRIDDYRAKIRFLKNNVWNRRLMETAQRHNLA